MLKKMGVVSVIHLLALSLLLLPVKFKGPSLFNINSLTIHFVDGLAISIIFIGTIFMYYCIYSLTKKNARPNE